MKLDTPKMKGLLNILFVNISGKRNFSVFIVLLAYFFSSFSIPYPDTLGLRTVVIDAGHGGKDPGCLGASAQEKHVALSIALKLGDAIERTYKDVKVIYTRKTDEFIELHERANIANRNKADLFICVHANASLVKTTSGTETYAMGLHKTTANLNVAKRENSSILLEENHDNKYEGFDPDSDESYIIFNLMQSSYLEQSLNFAAKIQAQFKAAGRKDRGVRQAGFLVLWRTAMPSVLIEAGFLSNPEEEKFLADEKNQKILAESIFNAFKEYKKEVDSKFSDKRNEGKTHKEETSKEVTYAIGGTKYEKTTAISTGLFYTVQLISSSHAIPTISQNFNGLAKVIEYEENGIYKYTYGKHESLEGAGLLKTEARDHGYSDAFIVAFNNGKRITLTEARELSNSGNKSK